MTAALPQKHAELGMRGHLDNHAGVVKVVNHHGLDVIWHEAERTTESVLDVFGSHIDTGAQRSKEVVQVVTRRARRHLNHEGTCLRH